MHFKNFLNLIDQINADLGKDFCNLFQYTRKELTDSARVAIRDVLLGNVKDDWAINTGGGTELQYHISIDNDHIIYYGLAFNTQYVPFANQKPMKEYLRPFMEAFIKKEAEIKTILPDYEFVIGNRKQLQNPENNTFILFGKTIQSTPDANGYSIADNDYMQLNSDLKKQLPVYELIFKNRNSKDMKSHNQHSFTDIFNIKKQIILQGPPGTGKTRLAGLLADELLMNNTIGHVSIEDIRSHLHVGLSVETSTQYSFFTITAIETARVNVKPENSNSSYPVPFDAIAEAIRIRLWEGGIKNGNDPYRAAIAKYIFKKIQADACLKLIQFHPAYGYEDFVRGISATTKNGTILYETQNRVLAEIASDALNNYKNSLKPTEELAQDAWINKYFDEMWAEIEQEIATNGKVPITPLTFISEIDDYSFRYRGEDWNNDSRIFFEDLKKLIAANIPGWNGTPVIDNALSRHARYRKSYYSPLIKRFFSKAGEYVPEREVSQKTNNYILIIDEINRANLPAVLGELIYALEYRGKPVQSLYAFNDDNTLVIPPNLYIIGTMNTADRSVGHIDYAIRRRFAFIDVPPEESVIQDPPAKALFNAVRRLFIKEGTTGERSDFLASDFQPMDVMPGHSYFREVDPEKLKLRLQYEIKPLLLEYLKDGVLNSDAKQLIIDLNV